MSPSTQAFFDQWFKSVDLASLLRGATSHLADHDRDLDGPAPILYEADQWDEFVEAGYQRRYGHLNLPPEAAALARRNWAEHCRSGDVFVYRFPARPASR